LGLSSSRAFRDGGHRSGRRPHVINTACMSTAQQSKVKGPDRQNVKGFVSHHRYMVTESNLVGEDKVSSSRCHGNGATRGRAARVVVLATAVLTVLVSAVAVHVVTLECDGEVELLVGGGSVLEDCEPCSTVGVTNTKVERSIVTPRVCRGTPLAAILSRNTGRVDVVLSRGTLSSPLVVGGIRAGQVCNAARVGSNGHSLTLSTGVVSTADSSA
jgi:hypothetical protein